MKKKIIILTLAIMLVATGVVSAAANWGKFEGYNIVKLVVNGKEVAAKDTPPVILKGRTMVPLTMLEKFGLEASWNKDTYTVNIVTNQSNTSDDIEELRAEVYAMHFFKSLYDTGHTLEDVSNYIFSVYHEIMLAGEKSLLKEAYSYLETAIEEIDYVNTFLKEMNDFFTEEALKDIHIILSDYKSSLENYRAGLKYLDSLSAAKPNEAVIDKMFDSMSEGDVSIMKGMELALEWYNISLHYIIDK